MDIEEDLWKFDVRDLEAAIMGIAYPRKRKPDQSRRIQARRIQALNDLIMGRFEEGGIDAFRQWSGEIHAQFIENHTVDTVDDQVIKILKWDPGKYLILFYENLFINLKIVNISLKHQHIEHL